MANAAFPWPKARFAGCILLVASRTTATSLSCKARVYSAAAAFEFAGQPVARIGQAVDHRAAVRVREVHQQAIAGDARLGLDPLGDGFGDRAGQSDQVGGEDRDLAAFGVLDDHGLGPERMERAFGRMVSRGVAGQPDRPAGRDVGLRDAHLPRGGGGRGAGSVKKRTSAIEILVMGGLPWKRWALRWVARP